MKLIRCYVATFGKLKNFSYEFSDGLNNFKEDNGWGKSTLATFIKAMFYGITSGKRSVAENERLKYRPWNSTERFGGNIEFEWGNKQFKIERYFGAKESEDTLKLFDAITGKEFSNTVNLGQRIFEIDEEGFLSTTYFAQKDFEIKSNSSLTAKFNSVCEIQDAQTFDKALLKLEDRSKHYKYRGDKGLIPDTKREIFAVSEEIAQAEKASVVIKTLKEETKQLSLQVENLKNSSSQLADKVSYAGKLEAISVKKERYKDLLEEKANAIKEKENADIILRGRMPREEELQTFLDCYNETVGITATKKAIESEIDGIKYKLSQIKESKKIKPLKNISIIFSVLFFVLGFVGVFSNIILSIVGFLLSLCFICLFIICVSGKKVNGEKSVYLTMLNEQEKKKEEIEKLLAEYLNKLNIYLSQYNLPKTNDMVQSFNSLKQASYMATLANEKLKKIEQAISSFENDKDMLLSNENIGNINTAGLKEQLSIVQDEYSKKANILASKKASIKAYEEIVNSLSDLENRKAQLVFKLEQYQKELDIVNLAIEYLKKADENLKIKYRAPLQESLNKYLSYIDSEIKATIDIDLVVTVNEISGQKITDYYSKGYQNLFEICKRFALTDVLFQAEKPFIILDDPFFNLDDEKVESALSLIKKMSKDYQILYFVCHNSRSINEV